MKHADHGRRKAAAGRRRHKTKHNTINIPSKTVTVTIESLGGLGAGFARYEGQPLYIPLTAPGDTVTALITGKKGDVLQGTLQEIHTPGPERCPAPCPYYGTCGGCSLQHLATDFYQEWKINHLRIAFAKQGIEALLMPLVAVAPGGRRRATLVFQNTRNGLVLGFHRRQGHEMCAIDQCLLLHPTLNDFLPRLCLALPACLEAGSTGSVALLLTENGIDMVVEAALPADSLRTHEALATLAETLDLARLSWRMPNDGSSIQPLFNRKPAIVLFDGLAVEPPANGFLQPDNAGQNALWQAVKAGLPPPVAFASAHSARKSSVMDLFCGCGTFSLPLAKYTNSPVRAIDGDAPSLHALATAAARHNLPITTDVRDLARRPLLPAELEGVETVVFDPPRSGAQAQAEHIAATNPKGPKRVIAVSCNPATLARDAKILTDGPYRLLSLTPVDQFPWSEHLEAVAVFERIEKNA